MSRKNLLLSLSLIGVCGFAASSASAQLLPGNVWPNSTLATAAPAGADPVDLFFGPTGDSNPRPDGWHRGGGDFGTLATPVLDLWAPSEATTPSPAPSGFALAENDTTASTNAEWFSDYNTLPASSVLTGTPFAFRFFWEYTNVASTQKPAGSDMFRVSVRWGIAGQTIQTGDLGGGPDELIFAGSPDLTTWTEVDEMLTPPVGASTMEVTVDTGGSGLATGQLYVDDISAASVPEPTCIAGITAGSMLLMARRRRRA